MRGRGLFIWWTAFCVSAHVFLPAWAMEAPGRGGDGWYYDQRNFHWYYFDAENRPHTGWLKYEGEWYWFDSDGQMADGGYQNVDGLRYYFFINGNMAWNQYVEMKYMDKDGQNDKTHDIRVIGSGRPTNEDRDLISDALYLVPRGWIEQFIRDGWELMFYKKKKYFAAPDTDMGIYYVYHSTDTNYKKVKFAEAEAVLQGFGEYIGYAAGCYEKEDARMRTLWGEQAILRSVLEIPGYYANDARFYFGKLFVSYMDDEKKERMEKLSPKACEVMEEIIHMKDDPAVYARQKARKEAQKAEAAKRMAVEESYGPGIPRQEETLPDDEAEKHTNLFKKQKRSDEFKQ